MRRSMVFALVAALVVAMTAGTALAKPGKPKPKPAKTVTYVFSGTVAATPQEGATSLPVNVTGGNKEGRAAAKGKPQISFAVTTSGKEATKIELDGSRAALSDLRAGDAVVVQSKAPQGATSFTARIISAESPAPAPYYLDADGDGIGAGEPEEFAPNRVPEGYVSAGGDNCADVSNPDQADADGNGVGDACEPVVDEPAPAEGAELAA